MMIPFLTFHAHRAFAIECVLCGAFSNFSAALKGLGKFKSEISHEPPELQGQRPQGCLMRTETEIAHSGAGKAELILICAAAFSLQWVMNMLVEDKPWLPQCCCGCTLGREPQGVGYDTCSIWQLRAGAPGCHEGWQELDLHVIKIMFSY